MPRFGGCCFDQSYTAQAAVETASMLIVASRLVETPADAKQVVPMIEQLKRLPEELGLSAHALEGEKHLDLEARSARTATV